MQDIYPMFEKCDTIVLASPLYFWTFEQPISYYRFLTKAIGWTDICICVVGGYEVKQGKRKIHKIYLDKAYQMGKNLT